MGQVPAFSSYLIIGGGRMARHFRLYLEFESIPFIQWTRSEGAEALAAKARSASHILVLIGDGAIEPFIAAHHKLLSGKTVIHFSGALTTPLAHGAHPLMTFSTLAYSWSEYRRIPFVLEKGGLPFSVLLPLLSNPSFELDAHDKTRYHALCAMAGGFTVLLWEKAFTEFAERFGLPKSVLVPYLERISKNLVEATPGTSVLTGPLARGDRATIEKHLQALANDSYSEVYRAFTAAFETQGRTL